MGLGLTLTGNSQDFLNSNNNGSLSSESNPSGSLESKGNPLDSLVPTLQTQPANLPVPSQSVLNTVLEFARKGQNEVVLTLGKTLGLKNANKVSAIDILDGKKEYGSHQFIDDVLSRVGIKRSDKTTTDKVINFATDLALDVVTDPLTYLGIGFMAKFGRTAMKSLPILRSLEASAQTGLKAVALDRAITGGVIGALGSNYDQQGIRGTAENIGKGIILGGLTSIISKEGLPILNKATEQIYNSYALSTLKGSKIEDALKAISNEMSASEAFKRVNIFKNRTSKFKDWYIDVNSRRLSELVSQGGDELVNAFDNITAEGNSLTIAKRNQLVQEIAEKVDPKKFKGKEFSPNEYFQALTLKQKDAVTTASNTYAGKLIDAKLKSIGNDNLTKAVNDYIKDNRKFIKVYNESKLNQANQIVGLDFHVNDILSDTDLGELYGKKLSSKVKAGFHGRIKEEVNTADLSLADRIAIGGERYAKAFASRKELKAIKLNAAIKESGFTGILGDTGTRIDNAIKSWDKFRNFWKSSVLGFSASWIKNNFTENLLRGYMLNGLEGAIVSGKGMIGPETVGRLLKLTGEDGFKYLKDIAPSELRLADHLGVIDNSFFGDLLKRSNKGQKILFLKGKLASNTLSDVEQEIFKKELAKTIKPSKISSTLDQFTNMLQKTTFRAGGIIENGARHETFMSIIKKGLKDNPELAKEISQYGDDFVEAFNKSDGFRKLATNAKNIVNDTFFDYKNVNVFEERVLKRVLPFYSFYSKNLVFHVNNLFEDTNKFAKLAGINRNIGRRPTNNELSNMPEWLRNMSAKVSRTEDKFLTTPNVSIIDAFEMFDMNNFGSKLDPTIKTIVENLRNKEFGISQPVRPDFENPIKRLFGNSILLNKTGLTKRDSKGRFLTDDKIIGQIDNLKKNLLPLPVVSQILSTIDDINKKGLSTQEAVSKKLAPVVPRVNKADTLQKGLRLRKRKAKLKAFALRGRNG